MCGYVGRNLEARDYLSCIFLYPLQVGCYIMSKTKRQCVTVDISLQNKAITSVAVAVLVRNKRIEARLHGSK